MRALSFRERLREEEAKAAAAEMADPWRLTLERVRGKVDFYDGLERVSSQTLLDLLEVPQRSRTAGTFHSACRVFLGTRAGFGPAAHGPWRVFRDAAVNVLAEGLARRLPIFGTFLFQALSDASSRWMITDVNPRAARRMSAAVGADFAIANLADVWGEPTDRMLQPIVGEYIVAREYTEYVISAPSK